MKTSPECLPCFLRQAEYAAGIATNVPSLRKEIMDQAVKLIPSFDLEISPPENSVSLYRMIAEKSNNADIFADLKTKSNHAALEMLPAMEDNIRYAKDPLDTAIRLAIAGNIIDYGSQQEFDVDNSINRCLSDPLVLNDLNVFKEDLQQTGKILYLADNCGELVFDRLLIEFLDRPVTLAVKEHPIINDALLADAQSCGLEPNCRIISNGTGCPGTPLENCNREFIKEFESADLIISKGQGNFETLSEIPAPAYFMLMVKCPVVAAHLGEISGDRDSKIGPGDLVLMKQKMQRAS